MFRSLKSITTAARPLIKPTSSKLAATRSFTISAIRTAGAGPPQLLGEGVKAGQVPTDEQQATGLERFELMGKLEGVDVFDMNPIEMTRLGTVKEPIPIYSLYPERLVGCTGFPADSHDTVWLRVNDQLKNHRCQECGCVYTLNFQGDPNAHHH